MWVWVFLWEGGSVVDRVGMGEGQEFLKKGVKRVGERQRARETINPI